MKAKDPKIAKPLLTTLRSLVLCIESKYREDKIGDAQNILSQLLEMVRQILKRENDYNLKMIFIQAEDIILSALERLEAGNFGKEDIKAKDYNFSDFEAFKSFVDMCKAA